MIQLAKQKQTPDVDHWLAIEAKGITVAYRQYQQRPTSLKEAALQFVQKGKSKNYSTFHALENVDLTVKRGQIFGLIGSNGSGKSTLLKVIAGVLKPIQGEVAVRGRISSLIELGAGFDPELNAIENIYLHCSLHGKTRQQIKGRVDGIIDFAELHDFAYTPIKYYSSGMFARLGFSVAMDIDPDILLIDEILGVGDERFQEKCQKVFEDFVQRKKTIVLVTHSLEQMENLVDEAALIEAGHLVFQGLPGRALELYREKEYQTALK